jgi:hypothetical protein
MVDLLAALALVVLVNVVLYGVGVPIGPAFVASVAAGIVGLFVCERRRRKP